MDSTTPQDPAVELVAALDALLESVDANIERAKLIKRRIRQIRRTVANGVPVVDVLAHEPRPLIVELISENVEELHRVGSRLRWAEAAALREQGLSVADIARLFGVARQRISALLNEPPKSVVAGRR